MFKIGTKSVKIIWDFVRKVILSEQTTIIVIFDLANNGIWLFLSKFEIQIC